MSLKGNKRSQLRHEVLSSARGPEGPPSALSWEMKAGIIVAKREWESGKPAFGFPLFHPRLAELWECGNLAAFARFPRGGGNGGKLAFQLSTVSTDPSFPQLLSLF